MSMRPESSSAIIRPDLQESVNEYNATKAQRKFIGRQAAPIFRSQESTGDFPIFRRAGLKKRLDTKRADGAEYKKVIMEHGKATFSTDDHGLEGIVDERKKKKYKSLFDAEAAATLQTNTLVLLDAEYRVAQLYANAGLATNNASVTWTTSATATPINDIETRIDAICDAAGVSPEDLSLVIPRTDFRNMLRTTQVNDKIKYTYPGLQPALLKPMQLAAMLQIKQVLVAMSVYDSKEEGITETNTQMWPANTVYIALLCDEDDPLEEQSAFRTILWEDYCPDYPTMESYEIPSIKSSAVRARLDSDEIMLGEANLFAQKLVTTAA